MSKSSGSKSGGSFLPAEYVKARAEHRTGFLSIVLFMVIMFSVVSAFFLTNRRWETVRVRDEQITNAYESEAGKIQQLHELEARQAQMAEKAEIVNALHEQFGRSVLLAEINTRRPNDDLDILELRLVGKRIKSPASNPRAQQSQVRNLSNAASVSDKNQAGAESRPRVEPPRYIHTLTLIGVSSDNASITDYLAKLSESSLLDRVELKYIEETVIDKQRFRKFEIEAKLVEKVSPGALDLARYTELPTGLADGDAGAEGGESEPGGGDGEAGDGVGGAEVAGGDDEDAEGLTLRSIFAIFGGGEG